MSGVRSSWLASATNWRIRSSDRRAAASDLVRARNEDSIWASMAFSARPSRPTSVRGSWSGTRRDRSPAAMAPAVSSMSVSGRRLARTMATPTMARATTMMRLTSRSIRASQASVVFTLPRSVPTTRITVCGALVDPMNPLEMTALLKTLVMTRQLPVPDSAGTVVRCPECAASHALLVGTLGPSSPGPAGPVGVSTWPRAFSTSTSSGGPYCPMMRVSGWPNADCWRMLLIVCSYSATSWVSACPYR